MDIKTTYDPDDPDTLDKSMDTTTGELNKSMDTTTAYDPDDFEFDELLDVPNEPDDPDDPDDPDTPEELEHEQCPNCFAKNSVFNDPRSGLVCESCSIVIKSMISSHQNFTTNDDSTSGTGHSRCGGPVNLFLENSNGSITVGIGNKRAEKVQRWTALPYRQRTLWIVYQKMKAVANDNNIPNNVLAESKILYKTLSEKEIITRAMPKQALEATCFYKACNVHGLGRTHKEVAKMFKVPVSYMTDGINRFNSLMMDTIHNTTLHKSEANTVPSYIERYSDLLMMTDNHVKVCNAIATNTILMGILCESIPTSIAVASLYFMIQYYKLRLPLDAILKRLEFNKSLFDLQHDKLRKKKRPEKALLSALTLQSDVTITKTYKKMDKFKDIITANINVTSNVLDIYNSVIHSKFI